ncbi:MAG: bifunctional metallophosphatase/5'-nucleotidase [Oscillospiraceae bacterium]|nr:bifunctional metallophosphatase/5'-nucleotidase [Oscillospiraceae bacterium]
MKKRIVAVFLCLLLAVSLLPMSAFAALNSDDIIILYENDVHCSVDGYSKLAAMKNELKESYAFVGVVSGGDYIQGSSLGAISRGEYIIDIMNLVGYDAVTLGNHEFDFRLDRLNELVGMMNTKPVCCNFQNINESGSYFDPYTIVSYGEIDIAYIGVTTPSTVTSSSPAQFKDDTGAFVFTFNPATLFDVVQANIESAKAAGADYVIAITHIGYAEGEIYEGLNDIVTLIENTDGLDVVLDAHSHRVIEGVKVTDKGGNEVLLSSTGTKFENIGKLTISNGEFKTELIKTADYEKTDPTVDAYLQQMYEDYAVLGDRKVALSEVDLIIKDGDGNRLVRIAETNLGDLCADAYRYALGADIGYVNGGGLRADIPAGDITFNDLLNVHPFNNTLVLAEVSGQAIKDMMEVAMMSWPEENGSFPHLSGLTFSVNTSIPSSVVMDEMEEFASVSGEYRVYDLKVYNPETEAYEPLDLNKIYTFAASNYFLLEYGSGMAMLEGAKVIQNDGMLDVEALDRYIGEVLNGVVGEEYAEVKTNITFTEGEIIDDSENDVPDTGAKEDAVLWMLTTSVSLFCVVALGVCCFKETEK